ncbi:MAG: inositol monophosphatase family protein, partial [Burkholderiales bacterium]
FDLYLHGGQKLWDYAAGALILAESGGYACSLDDNRFWNVDTPWQRSVVAASDRRLFGACKRWLRAALET